MRELHEYVLGASRVHRIAVGGNQVASGRERQSERAVQVRLIRKHHAARAVAGVDAPQLQRSAFESTP